MAENRNSKSARETAVVICPGRGTYNTTELGYLKRYHSDKTALIAKFDAIRHSQGQLPVSELDALDAFKPSLHTSSENASALIYACAMADCADIDLSRFDIVAVTGNSMGWYLALAAAGALSLEEGMTLVNSMGTLMQQHATGGQVIYPLVDENWQPDPKLSHLLMQTLLELQSDPENEIHTSIELGGMRVLAANDHALRPLLHTLPPQQDRFPMQLHNHAAFHSPLLNPVSKLAREQIPPTLLHNPHRPLVDGRGHIWSPYAVSLDALYHYTLTHQVVHTYDYAKAIEVSVKEFAPDRLIILGPGSSLGPPTAQELIRLNWKNLKDKADFTELQKNDPFILAMGIESQRRRVVKAVA